MKPRQLLNRSLNAASFIMTFHHQYAATVCIVTNFLTLLDLWCWGKVNNYSVHTQTDIVVDLSKDTSTVLF